MERFMIIYLVIVNIWGYISMARDKQKAIKHAYRTPEKHLWFIAWIGGAWGSMLGMQVKRHKTRTNSFRFGMPLLCLMHILIWGSLFLH